MRRRLVEEEKPADRTVPMFNGEAAPPVTVSRETVGEFEVPPGAFVENGRAYCSTCKNALTITPLGAFFPCGHGTVSRETGDTSQHKARERTVETSSPTKGKSEPKRPGDLVLERVGQEAPETVTATWGKELFSPKQYHTFEVGPFAGTTNVRSGETRAQAMTRLLDDLREVAEAERKRKRESFLKALEGK